MDKQIANATAGFTWWKTITWRLGMLLVAIVFFLIVGTFITVNFVNDFSRRLASTSDLDPVVRLLSQANDDSYAAMEALRLAFDDRRAGGTYRIFEDKSRSSVEAVKNLLHNLPSDSDSEFANWLNEADAALNAFSDKGRDFFSQLPRTDLVDTNWEGFAIDILLAAKLRTQAGVALSKVRSVLHTRMDFTLKDLGKLQRRFIWMTVLVTGVFLLPVILFGVFLARYIRRSIEDVIATTEAVGKGDFTKRALVQRADELGSIAASVNEMTEALRESQQLPRAVFDALPTGVQVKDTSGKYILVNSNLASLYGHRPETLVGLTFQQLGIGTEEQKRKVEAHDQDVIRKGGRIEIRDESLNFPRWADNLEKPDQSAPV